jgi:drug/metabolite transporter (DMT)-like permease
MTVASATAAPERGLLAANLICMMSMLVWAAALPAADHLIPLLPHEQLNALRMGLAGLTLIPIWAAMEGLRPLLRANWLKGVGVGGLIGLGAWFLILGQARGGAVTAAVISSSLPVAGIALEVVLDGRRLTLPLVLGVILSLVGGMMALDLGGGGLSLGLGAVLCFLSVLTYALGSRLTVTAFPDETPIGRSAVTLAGAGAASVLVALVQHALGYAPAMDLSHWGATELGAILLYAIGGMALSQVLWIMSVGRLGIGMSSLHINAAPFYVMIILFALGRPWDWSQAGGALLVGIGVLVAQGLIPLGQRR